MHPAPSIILFTVLSGAGFGLVFWLGLGLGPNGAAFSWPAVMLASLMTLGGLAASTKHLGHPERAKLALTQWRSSWLSREGVLAAATLAVFALYAAGWLFLGVRIGFLGLLAAVGALATVYATSMIYAQLRTVPSWNTGQTPALFLVLAGTGGLIAASALAYIAGQKPDTLIWLAGLGLVCAAAMGVSWVERSDNVGLSDAGTPESATGLGHIGEVRLLESPHSSPNYLLKEMVHVVGRRRARQLRLIAAGLGLALPLLLVFIAGEAGGWAWLLLAFISHIAGALASRWLFFAEARHTVGLYYGHR